MVVAVDEAVGARVEPGIEAVDRGAPDRAVPEPVGRGIAVDGLSPRLDRREGHGRPRRAGDAQQRFRHAFEPLGQRSRRPRADLTSEARHRDGRGAGARAVGIDRQQPWRRHAGLLGSRQTARFPEGQPHAVDARDRAVVALDDHRERRPDAARAPDSLDAERADRRGRRPPDRARRLDDRGAQLTRQPRGDLGERRGVDRTTSPRRGRPPRAWLPSRRRGRCSRRGARRSCG